jgi:hypothetical protein
VSARYLGAALAPLEGRGETGVRHGRLI